MTRPNEKECTNCKHRQTTYPYNTCEEYKNNAENCPHYEPSAEKTWTCPPDCYLINVRDTENQDITLCTQCTRNPEVKDQYLTRQQYIKEYGVNPDF